MMGEGGVCRGGCVGVWGGGGSVKAWVCVGVEGVRVREMHLVVV